MDVSGEEKKEKPSEIIVVEEWSGSSSTKLSRTATITASPWLSIQRSGSRLNQVWRRILEAFVPEGFPSSVTPDYLPFQFWDSLQGLSTYIRTMLSTQALLSAIGVGEKSATVIGATFQWFLRDLTGMLGGVLFTCYQGSNLDSSAKMWRLVADLMNDLGMLMDLVSPLFPSAFVFVVCLGSLSRSFTGVASGATRAALTQHFALQNNAADISAKEGSQETVATMIGMAFGMLLARITMGHALAIWLSFLSLTVFHMYANYKAVRCLSLTTLNSERSSILLQHFMETGQDTMVRSNLALETVILDNFWKSPFLRSLCVYIFFVWYSIDVRPWYSIDVRPVPFSSLLKVLSPDQVSVMENVLPFWTTSWSSKSAKLPHTQVHLGVRISSLDRLEILDLMHLAGSHYKKAKYVLVEKNGIVSVIMHKDSTAEDVLKSFMHALVMANVMENNKSLSAHLESQSWMDKHHEDLIHKLKLSGWKAERLLSPSIVWRADWICGLSDQKID